MTEPRKIFKTIVNGETCWVYDRPKHKHKLGKWNALPETWWLLYHSSWIPWIDNGANRPCWDIRIKQGNYIKTKWDEQQIRGTCGIQMYCNNTLVYHFVCRDIEYGFAKAQKLITDMIEHPFNFTNPEEEVGRKIWYYEQPASIERLMLDQGCIMIQYEGDGDGFDLTRPWDDDEWPDEWDGEKKVKDDVLTPTINWFRK